MRDAMLDLEFTALTLDAAIVQVGLVMFEPATLEQGATLLLNIDLMDALLCLPDSAVDRKTLEWWAHPERSEARASLREPAPQPLEAVLDQVASWFREHEPERVWSHGATTDITMLQLTYERLRRAAPWHYRAARDTRTLHDAAALLGWEREWTPPTLAHNALADARAQATTLSEAHRWICKFKSS